MRGHHCQAQEAEEERKKKRLENKRLREEQDAERCARIRHQRPETVPVR